MSSGKKRSDKMASNRDLNKAALAKKDEFYTQLTDIEKEMRYYRPFFAGKTVLCNCDDPYESNFFKYFAMNFNALKLKKLIATCYAGSPVAGQELGYYVDQDGQLSFLPELGAKPMDVRQKHPYKVEITEVSDANGDGRTDLADVEYLLRNRKNSLTLLKGDGDFRSEECVKLLKQADIVTSNPPFSLFRQYIEQLFAYDKKFIILGNMNAIHYKEVFPLIRDNRLWLGASIHSGDRKFNVPDDYPLKAAGCGIDPDGRKYIRVKGIRWFTNLDIEQRHEHLILYKHYSSEEYPEYYNYQGIDVSKVSDIPCDYYGNMGVPDNFIDVYNPDQFEIVGLASDVPKTMIHKVVGDEIQYIKDGVCVWHTPYTVSERKAGNSLRIKDANGLPGKLPYSRIIIRRKVNESHED